MVEEVGGSQEEREAARARAEQKLAREVTEDFLRRREARRSLESGWLLDLNFLSGNQYCDVSPLGGVVDEDKRFYWQSRRVFNHIAPTLDSRVTRLERMRPVLQVRAFSDEDGDLLAAKLATGVLKYVRERVRLDETVSKATLWSECCGSAFYKVAWNERGGRQVGEDQTGAPLFEGEASVDAVSPFEIYPDRLNAESIGELNSLIHARVADVDEIFEKFGVEVQGEEIARVGIAGHSEPSSGKLPAQSLGMQYATVENGVILIERYTRPSGAFPNGRLEIVAGGKLLYEGDLPYCNGERGERDFPFVKQDCLRLPAAFFASSVVDRLIPVQRAYNAVRNRKHEFLNRLSMGVLTVEDGSVDTEELCEEGLLPGKVLVYRQGGKAPAMLDCGSVPAEFADEEAWLEKEFSIIGGVNDVMQSSVPVGVTSATGLQLLTSRDDARLTTTADSIERAMREIGRQVLRLYRQYAGTARLLTITGENKRAQVYYFNASDLQVNDLQFEAREAVNPEEKRATILKLLETGVLTGEDGKLSAENKHRILEAFGFGGYENARDISALHIAKAAEENLDLKTGAVEVDEYDDHDLHAVEHTRFLLSAEFKKLKEAKQVKARVLEHIKKHEERAGRCGK